MVRLFDIALSLAALLVLSPMLLPVAVILKFTGEGEVFFIQQRIGRDGKFFGLYKFATMLKNSPHMDTGTVTLMNDPRVLPVGKFLRKTKINELPQLLNVLFGQMSVIGPRPQTPRCFNAFPADSQKIIGTVLPGLSGVGSIIFRGEEELLGLSKDPNAFYDDVIMPYKGQLEEWFVRNQSLRVYCICIFLTGWIIFYPRSALAWRLFPSLPTPPTELIDNVNWIKRDG